LPGGVTLPVPGVASLTGPRRVAGMTGTWHYGLIARWWAEVNRPEEGELAYLRAAIRRYGGPALDLGCGTGRLLLPLLAEGFDVDGVDISGDMIDRLREAAATAGLDVKGRVEVQPFDRLDRPRRYRTVFSIGSFAIGGSGERDAAALRGIRRQLVPGGAVVLSYEVLSDADHAAFAGPEWRYPEPWPATGPRAVLEDGDELELRIRTTGYDPATRTRRLELRARLLRDGLEVREETGQLANTYYPPSRLEAMLRAAGFTDIAVEGPYTGRPPDPADTTIVIVAR
jgi:SAM-dependent methyltransferase